MTALMPPLVIALLLLVAGLLGPWLLRSAAPVLMRAPRAAVALLLTGLGTWLLAVAALSLMLAWTLTGPQLLSGAFGDVCQRCLDAASPFASEHTFRTSLPVIALVLLPALGAAVLAGLGVHRTLRARRSAHAASADILVASRRARLAGEDVWLLPEERPVALALPRRHGGIVVSEGLLRTLSSEELVAVLAHERAHLHQHHHLVLGALRALVEPLRWVPLAAAIADAVPHYLEVAADRCARDRTGTPALASALLKIGSPVDPSSPVTPATVRAGSTGAMLHAGGPDRIRQLVAPTGAGSALLPAAVLLAMTLALAVVTLVVHGPYLQVLLTGCAIAG